MLVLSLVPLACGCVPASVILMVDLVIASRWPPCPAPLGPSEPHFGRHTWTFGTVYHPQGSLRLADLDVSLSVGLSQQGWHGAGHQPGALNSPFPSLRCPRKLLFSPLPQPTSWCPPRLVPPPSHPTHRNDSQFHSLSTLGASLESYVRPFCLRLSVKPTGPSWSGLACEYKGNFGHFEENFLHKAGFQDNYLIVSFRKAVWPHCSKEFLVSPSPVNESPGLSSQGDRLQGGML